MMRFTLISLVLAFSSVTASAQVKFHLSPPHHKKYETIRASIENIGSKPVTFCIEIGQTSPKGDGGTEATPSPFWVQRNNNGKWSTLLIGPDVGSFQKLEVLAPGKSLEFPFRLGESGQMRLRLNYWTASSPNLTCDARPKDAKLATSAPFVVE